MISKIRIKPDQSAYSVACHYGCPYLASADSLSFRGRIWSVFYRSAKDRDAQNDPLFVAVRHGSPRAWVAKVSPLSDVSKASEFTA